MRLSCNYEVLINNLISVATVVDDAMVSDDLKNIIFSLSKSKGFRLIGVSRLITHKITIPVENYSMDLAETEDDVMFQLKSKEIINYLNAYKSLRRTTVDDVIFENVNNSIKCTVVEKAIEEDTEFGEEPKEFVSSWIFNQVPIKPNMLGTITKELPEDVEVSSVTNADILAHTRNLLPVMQNVTSMYGKLMFSKEYVIAFSNAYTAVMQNLTPIEGVSLSYKAVSFIDKIICLSDMISIAKTQTDLYFSTDNSETFILYEAKLPNYQPWIDMFKKDHAVTLDRVYLKDVLKRFSLVDENIECTVLANDGVVKMRNKNYSQDIELIRTKAMESFEKLSFKILPAVLDKAIIGSDADFYSELFIYYNNENGCLILSDASGSWFTVVRVKIA